MLCVNNRAHYGPVAVFIFCILQYLIIIIMQTYQKELNFWNDCQLHSVECVSKIKSIVSVIYPAIYGDVGIQLTHVS